MIALSRTISLSLLIAGTLTAQSKPHNGYWWKETGDSMRLGYVIGFVEATSDTQLSLLILANRHKSVGITTDAQAMSADRDYSGIRFGQLIEGTNAFYIDYRNMAIHTDDALRYVRDSLKGYTDAQLEAELTTLRRISTDPQYDPK